MVAREYCNQYLVDDYYPQSIISLAQELDGLAASGKCSEISIPATTII